MSTFRQFWEGHNRANYTPVFNAHLESQFTDEGLCIETRVMAWCLRMSWGNHSDSCVDTSAPGGRNLNQTDCAKTLGVDKRRVNEAVAKLRAQHYLKTEGQVILPVNNPSGMPESPVQSDDREEEANIPAFESYLDSVAAAEAPDEYRAYQQAASYWKSYRQKWLPRYRKDVLKESARVRTSDDARPTGDGQPVRKGEDISSEGTGPAPAASLKSLEHLNVKPSSSSFSSVRKRFKHWAGRTDDDVFNGMVAECQKKVPDLTEEEIRAAVDECGMRMAKKKGERVENPAAFLKKSVITSISESVERQRETHAANMKEAERLSEVVPSVEEQIQTLQTFVAEMPNHADAPGAREQLKRLTALKAKGAHA